MSEEKEEKKSLGSMLEIGAILITALTLIGYIKSYLYYKCYNIKISYYISFEEILTPFLDDLLLFAVFLILNNATIGLLENLLKNKEINGRKSSFYLELQFIIPFFLIFVAMVYFNVMQYLSKDTEEKYAYELMTSTINLVIFLIFFLVFQFERLKSLYLPKSILLWTLFLFFILIYNVWDVKSKILGNKIQYKEIKYNFTFENSVVETDSTLVFLGRTKSSIFIQNKKEGRVDIYNSADIKKEYVK